jgi:hypothetical protein
VSAAVSICLPKKINCRFGAVFNSYGVDIVAAQFYFEKWIL